MNLDSIPSKKVQVIPSKEEVLFDDEFDFKPITSGLGFHQPKPAELKPVFTDRVSIPTPVATPSLSQKKEMSVYQNDLSLFYGQSQSMSMAAPEEVEEEEVEKTYKLATKTQRVFAYLTDLFFVLSILGMVMTVMARAIHMDLVEAWTAYPNEITPLVITLFAGFYIIYFSIFEMAPTSTLGKYLFGLRVTSLSDRTLPLTSLVLRSVITLANFVSLGLFTYFDLQNKVTQSKIIRAE